MVANSKRAVLDTNVLVSAIARGGRPREILSLVLNKELEAVTSPVLFAELVDILARKFGFTEDELFLVEEEIRGGFIFVHPAKTVTVVKKDPDDDRVLEAAWEGQCDYIITGDKELLSLKQFQSIAILTPSEFLKLL